MLVETTRCCGVHLGLALDPIVLEKLSFTRQGHRIRYAISEAIPIALTPTVLQAEQPDADVGMV